MLSREDSRRLALLERQLREEDPEFCARMEGAQSTGPARRKRFPLTLILTAAVILIAGVVLGILRWWIPAAVCGFCAIVVVAVMLVRAYRLSKS
jgi:CHASE2 domain-containing sensor protein